MLDCSIGRSREREGTNEKEGINHSESHGSVSELSSMIYKRKRNSYSKLIIGWELKMEMER